MAGLRKNNMKKILEEFKKEVKALTKEKFNGLVLYGSFARGDNVKGSDVDVLLLVKKPLTRKEEKNLSELTSSISLKYDLVFTCFAYPYEAYLAWETPFLMNVRKEGVRI